MRMFTIIVDMLMDVCPLFNVFSAVSPPMCVFRKKGPKDLACALSHVWMQVQRTAFLSWFNSSPEGCWSPDGFFEVASPEPSEREAATIEIFIRGANWNFC